MSKLLSDAYRHQLVTHHATQSWGGAGAGHIPEFLEHARGLGVASIVDYGAGNGSLARRMAEVEPSWTVQSYDPGRPEFSAPPVPADYVTCTDVLEHIEPKLLDNVLRHIWDLAGKGAYMNISCVKAKATLPDGRNAHLIVQPAAWWDRQLKRFPWKFDKAVAKTKMLRVWLHK